jgi:hypothetical protein
MCLARTGSGASRDAQGIGGVRSSREAAGANAEPRIARWGEAPCAQTKCDRQPPRARKTFKRPAGIPQGVHNIIVITASISAGPGC